MEKDEITPSLRPEANRTTSELEKATVTHVEKTRLGVSALEDETLMSGERQERVSRQTRLVGSAADRTAHGICRIPVLCCCRLWFLLWLRYRCHLRFTRINQG